MSAKRIIPAVLLSLVAANVAYAQAPLPAPSGNTPYGAIVQPPSLPPGTAPGSLAPSTGPSLPSTLLPSSPSAALVDTTQPVSPSAQNWLNASPCYCCSPVGRHGPIGAEVFVMTGPTLPAGGGTLTSRLNAGWMVEWGGRSLLFNAAGNAAWTASFGISYQNNYGDATSTPFLLPTAPGIQDLVQPRDLSRWAFSYAGGRDWFLFGSPIDGIAGTNLRVGFDVGGRWGSSHVSLIQPNNPDPSTNYIRRQDVFRSFFMGTHIDLEIPLGGWIWFGGFRAEYCFNWWTDLLPGSDNRLNDVNLLMHTGFRY